MIYKLRPQIVMDNKINYYASSVTVTLKFSFVLYTN